MLKGTNKVETNRYELTISVDEQTFADACTKAYKKVGKKIARITVNTSPTTCIFIRPTDHPTNHPQSPPQQKQTFFWRIQIIYFTFVYY